ncbi:ATP-dependent Clp protease proteolytic subunit [Patescibacteria group bacterium]|nr:ATP-dependent Clp protease proteolytic subunit [Patescibacteria group bacterium]
MNKTKFSTSDPIHILHEYNVDPSNLAVYLVGEEAYIFGTADEWLSETGVEYVMANRFIRNMQVLMHNGRDGRKYKPITVHMKTNGGDWSEGMAIYDTIRTCPNPITILNYTHARSMSGIILQAADRRFMMPHSYFMFHEGEQQVQGTEKQVRSYMKFSRKDNDVMLSIYADRMREKGKYNRWSKTKIKDLLQGFMDKKEDVYLTAREAVSWGLADEIFEGNWKKLWTHKTKPKKEEK